MGGGDPRTLPPDQQQSTSTPPSEERRLEDSPVLLFVYFHKAFRAEIAELRRMAVDAVESGSYSGGDLASELRRRFEFLKVVYKYHCAAEDEVVFLALDRHVKNVVCNYSLEHGCIDDLFGSIFHWLDILAEERENVSKAFQEVVFCIGTMQSFICQHMLKEEQQVFCLLSWQFSFQEQASLVWQFICSVPVMLLEDFLPWMMQLLSIGEQMEVEKCIKEVVPKEESLQLVIKSWLCRTDESSPGNFRKIHEGSRYTDRSADKKNALEVHSSRGPSWSWNKASGLKSKVGHNPIDGLHLWHNTIRKDLKEILEELCQIKISSNSLDLDVTLVRLNFLVDVLIFYSHAFEKFFYPVLQEITGHQALHNKHVLVENQVGSLQLLLCQISETRIPTSYFMEKLCLELESFIMEIGKQFALHETEVLPIISENCSHELQKHLLFKGLIVLPLGLLKCVIIWFSAHLSDDESQSIIHSISEDGIFINKSFASLLLEWFRIGYSGKTSVENFGEELGKMFKRRRSFLSEQIKEACESFSSETEAELCKESKPGLIICPEKEKRSLPQFPSQDCHGSKKYETPYSSGVTLQIFFSGNQRPSHPFPKLFLESSDHSVDAELVPIDLIFFFHKALKKDLDYLVSGSARLAEDFGFVVEFCQRFRLIRFLYQMHSDAEDEIAFPALEARGKVQNITHSYTIDHKLEVEHFDKVSFILHEMSELEIMVFSSNSNAVKQRKIKYQQLCLSLQDVCKSMHNLLSDHVRREEIQFWPLFREFFSIEEQEKIIGRMLGRIRAEILQDMIPWLMESLTTEEQHALMSLWRQATRKTMFDEWLAEWYDGFDKPKVAEESNSPSEWNQDPLETVAKYLSEGVGDEQSRSNEDNASRSDLVAVSNDSLEKSILDVGDESFHGCPKCKRVSNGGDKKRFKEEDGNQCQKINRDQTFKVTQKSGRYERLLTMSQEDLEAAIRRVSRDSSLDSQKKSYIMQNLLMSRWIVLQQIYNSEAIPLSSNREEIQGQHPSYQEPEKLIFGCKHYKRNCKLLTPCCNQLFTCIRCHDEMADHSVDRKSITNMMCMKCLVIQPIGSNCSNVSCNNYSMGKYYCRICKVFDDCREIYHCPYCNLCRLGKGLGVDFFHCMNCNACMSRSLLEHVCREKCLEDNCPICHEYIFTSSSPVKALPCGHVMHSSCFQEYTCSHYTCPICSKSLGDMRVYFRMLDALLAEEKIPEEYSNQTQVILCNDCARKGNAPFHWLYHKCPTCGSYNTRLL